MPQWNLGMLFRINGFTILIWTTVTFFSAIVSSYAGNYLKGFRFHSRFMMLCLGIHIIRHAFGYVQSCCLLLFSWLIMGIFMSQINWY